MVLPGNTGEDALRLCDRVRSSVKSTPFRFEGASMDITVSIGVVSWDGKVDADAVIAAADRAMYRAKQEGRDRVVLA